MIAWIAFLLFVACYFEDCISLRFVYLGVPGFALRGQPMWLECGYDLEGNELYSVKWYKDNVEFFRYQPDDRPSAQMYRRDGVFLDLDASNASHIFFHSTDLQTEGLYGCEVSTGMPQFRTIKAEKELHIYVVPKDDPMVSGLMNKYPVASILNVTCSFGPSKPAAILTWYINGEVVSDTFSQRYTEFHDKVLQTSKSRLHFPLDASNLIGGRLSLQCRASAFLVHSESSIEIIVKDHQIQHVTYVPPGQRGPNIAGNVDRYSLGDNVDLNCSSGSSLERAQMQWFLNDNEANSEYLSMYPPIQNPGGHSPRQLGLRFQVRKEHFAADELRLRCTVALVKVVETSTTRKIVAVGLGKSTDHLMSTCPTSGGKYAFVVVILLAILTFNPALSFR